MRKLLLITVILLATSMSAETCDALKALKSKQYGFSPAKLSSAEQQEKSKGLDEFWRATQKSGPDGVACLKSMLEAETEDKFFLFDGASLLYGLDAGNDSAKIAIRALSLTDLKDIDSVSYVNFAIGLAREGNDVTQLARKFLYETDGEINVPQHAMQLDHATVTMVLFGLMPPERTEQVLLEAIQDKRDSVKNAALMSLALSLTPASFKIISTVDPTTVSKPVGEDLKYVLGRSPVKATRPRYTRDQVMEILRKMPRSRREFEAVQKSRKAADARNGTGPITEIASYNDIVEGGIQTLTADDLDEVRHIRVRSIHSLSDESLGDYFAYTKMILGVINRLNLYAEFRTQPK